MMNQNVFSQRQTVSWIVGVTQSRHTTDTHPFVFFQYNHSTGFLIWLYKDETTYDELLLFFCCFLYMPKMLMIHSLTLLVNTLYVIGQRRLKHLTQLTELKCVAAAHAWRSFDVIIFMSCGWIGRCLKVKCSKTVVIYKSFKPMVTYGQFINPS